MEGEETRACNPTNYQQYPRYYEEEVEEDDGWVPDSEEGTLPDENAINATSTTTTTTTTTTSSPVLRFKSSRRTNSYNSRPSYFGNGPCPRNVQYGTL